MESVYSLIKCLNKSEFDTVRNFYAMQLQEHPEVEKTLSLLEFLRKCSEEPAKEDCMLHVYGKEENASFRQLKSRLVQRILDLVITESNLDKIDHVELYDIMSIKLRKKLSQVLYLYSTKGNIPVVYDILNSTIKSAEEYRIYYVLVEALRLKKMLLSIRASDPEIVETEERLKYYERCDVARNKAVNYYFTLIRNLDQKASAPREKRREMMEEAIEELSGYYAELKAPSVGYYLKILEMAYYSNDEEYDKAKEACLAQIDLLKSKELYRKERLGMAYDNVGRFEVLKGNSFSSLSFFRKAQTYYKPNSINLVISKEQEFFGLFYCGMWDEAERLVEELLILNQHDQGAFRNAKFMYYKAALKFSKGDFSACQRIINRNLEISSDKGGWDVATRFLTIMCNVEIGEFDTASTQIQSLKKHLERTRKKEDLSARDLLIFKTLLQLDKQGFHWAMISAGSLAVFQAGDNSRWKPYSPELVRFDGWLRSKLNVRKSGLARAKEFAEMSGKLRFGEMKLHK